MAMTRQELNAKNQIIKLLNEQGYPTYARLLDLFDLNLTKDPGIIGYMEVNRARIVLNINLNANQVSTIVRHEILHEYFTHHLRSLRWKEKNPKYAKIPHELVNIAADLEISNKGYTDEDKNNVRKIILGDQTLRGLVTEDENVDWVDLSFEEILDEIVKLREDYQQQLQQSMQGWNSPDPDIQSAEDLQRRAEAISDDAGNAIDENNPGEFFDGDDAEEGEDGAGNSGSSDDPGNSDESEEKPSSGSAKGTKPQDKKDKKDTTEEGSGQAGGVDDADDEKELEDTVKQVKQQADKVSKEAGKIADKMRDIEDEKSKSKDVFNTPEQQKKINGLNKRVEELKDIMKDALDSSEINYENIRNKRKPNKKKQDKEIAKYNADPLKQFEISLNSFIKTQIATGAGSSWSKFSKKYDGSGILRPGSTRRALNKIPLINVYFDRSGSWNTQKTESGYQTIAKLNQYVKRGLLKINLYYFSDAVYTDEQRAIRGGRTTEGLPIIQHINETHPDNVIILTDSDIDAKDPLPNTKVPGGVWLLFYDGRSQNLIDHLSGRKLTRYFDIINY